MVDLTAIADEVKLSPEITERVHSQEAIQYIKLVQLQKEINRKMLSVYAQLDDDEKRISNEAIMEMLSIPVYVNVNDAAYIIGVSAQMVRRYCAENKLNAEQTMPGSGKWKIEATQLMNYPGWISYVNERARMKEQSMNIAAFMNEKLDEL